MTKALITLACGALLSLGAVGCGGTHTPTGTSASQRAPERDRDNDGDKNDDDSAFLEYGHAALGAERQAIVSVVTQYYAAAAAADGAKVCTLLVPFVAEAAVENYSHQPGLAGKSCAVVMSKFYAQHHQLLSGENATLKFDRVRAAGAKALAILSFSVLPEVRQLTLRRIGGNWRVLFVLDGIIE